MRNIFIFSKGHVFKKKKNMREKALPRTMR